jgi:vanillate O-demethylase ferredoxin subunit
MQLDTLQVRVKSITWEADGVLSFDLRPLPPRRELPAFTAGAHVDVHLPNGLIRSYSLLNGQDERDRYVIGVNRDAASRGGSRFMHESVKAGDALAITAPRNNFALDEAAPLSVFIAGGIGITPLRSMIARLHGLGRRWRLHYAARTRQNAAFVDALQELRDRSGCEVHFAFDREPGAHMLDIPGIVAALPADAHVYCCGPLPMLETFERATRHEPPARVHVEYFAAREAAANEGGTPRIRAARACAARARCACWKASPTIATSC